jgi:hypothetical protein
MGYVLRERGRITTNHRQLLELLVGWLLLGFAVDVGGHSCCSSSVLETTGRIMADVKRAPIGRRDAPGQRPGACAKRLFTSSAFACPFARALCRVLVGGALSLPASKVSWQEESRYLPSNQR